MATGTQVPWTTPGATPCCCTADCFTDLQNDPVPSFAENLWMQISEEHYASLYAGGNYTAELTVDVASQSTGWLSGEVRGETHTAHITGLELLPSGADPCSFAGETNEGVTINVMSYNGFYNSYTSSVIQFNRHLATYNQQRWLSLALVNGRTGGTNQGFAQVPFLMQLSAFYSSLWFGSSLWFYVANAGTPQAVITCTHKKFTGATSTVILKVGDTDYVTSGGSVGCFLSASSMSLITHTGNVSLSVTFVPSAP